MATMKPIKQIYLDEILSVSRCAPTKFKLQLARRSSRTFTVENDEGSGMTRDAWVDYIQDQLKKFKY